MARVTFLTPDGVERTYLLDRNSTLHIGRDPSNDVILRDARVSRKHAEIGYEKGFFVLRDLSSANGSFVNGKKIRVAPLANEAEIKLGGSVGHFTSDNTIDMDGPVPTISLDLLKSTASDRESDEIPLPSEGDPFGTRPRQGPLPPKPHEDFGIVFPDSGPQLKTSAYQPQEPPPQSNAAPDERFTRSRYLLDLSVPYGERSTIRDESGNPLFFYKRPVNLLGYLAAMVASMILVAGVTAAVVLVLEDLHAASILAMVLTALFALAVLLLVPRRHVYIYDDASMLRVALMIWQESRFSFPRLRFSTRLEQGELIGFFSRSFWSGLGRRRWSIYDDTGKARLGVAVEDSLIRAILRKFFGLFFSAFRTNFRILAAGRQVGIVDRRGATLNQYQVQLTAGAPFDPRLLLGLAVVIDGLEQI